MKLPILILSLIATTSAIYAQSPQIKVLKNGERHTYSYKKGGDSLQLTILGKKDTVQETVYYRNGQPQSMVWKNDSSYTFDELGRLETIDYDVLSGNNTKKNMRRFYANGQLKGLISFKNNVYLTQEFSKTGQVLNLQRTIFAPTYTYKRREGKNGVLVSASRTDTLSKGAEPKTFTQDTVFYINGQPYRIYTRGNQPEYWGYQYFTKEGLPETTLTDSLILHPFKNNVECYYGLSNKRGDTVVQPRFDRIENIDGQFWLAYTGADALLLQPNGAPISTPFTHLKGIRRLNSTTPYQKGKNNNYWFGGNEHLGRDTLDRDYFEFKDGDKYGVVNRKLDIIVPPQYFRPGERYVGDAQYFEFVDKNKDTVKRTGYLTRQGVALFPDRFKGVHYTYFKDYFFLSLLPFERFYEHDDGEDGWRNDRRLTDYYDNDRFTGDRKARQNYLGIGKADGTIVLEPKYHSITHVDDALFIASVSKERTSLGEFVKHDGIYDGDTKKWLLDTIDFEVMNKYPRTLDFFIVKHVPTKKYGLMDKKGRYILPLSYESIEFTPLNQNFLVLKKGNTYQIATIKGEKKSITPKKYQYLTPMTFWTSSLDKEEAFFCFLAKQNNKWGVIDATGKVLKPFIYDYASKPEDYNQKFLLVKNNQAEYYGITSFPNELGAYPNFDNAVSSEEVRAFSLEDDYQTVFFINNSGKVIVPPQYKGGTYIGDGNFYFLQDAQKKKKFVFKTNGRLVDFPFTYSISWASPKSSVMLVRDSVAVSHGVVSTDGKVLVPTNNYGVAVGDAETSTFFVKHGIPLLNNDDSQSQVPEYFRVNGDSLNVEDQNWVMYDHNGKQVGDKPFRFPIQFIKGVGVGMKDADFSLYRTDGSKITVGGVQNFNNIRRVERDNDNFYALYFNQGMTPQLILTKPNGDMLIESGRYDGISKFYGKYALVSKAGKIGLVDTLGKEVLPPQDLTQSSQHLTDSLAVENRFIEEMREKYPRKATKDLIELPISFPYLKKEAQPDSLGVNSPQRAMLLNLMLQKSLHKTLKTASDVKIPRSLIKYASYQLIFNYHSDYYNDMKTHRLVVTDSTMAFVLSDRGQGFKSTLTFYNFYRHNNHWEELKINDILQIQGANRWKMNDLMIQKVKALKDEQIDCSNASAFVTTVENRWMLTKDGVDFCFDSTGSSGDLVIISFTWAELQPFLKLKIY
jgi:WG containing repeat